MKKTAILLACLVFLASAAFAADTVIEEIIARVNNSIITRQDLQRSREQTMEELRQKSSPAEAEQEAAKHEKDVLRDLIDQQLLVQKAADLGITGDTELIKRLDEIRKSMNLDSMEALEKAAQAQGISYEDFKSNLKNQILTQAVISREVGSKVQITPEEVNKYYEQHKSEYQRPERVRLSEILIAIQKPAADPKDEAAKDKAPETEDPAAVEAAQKKAQELLDSIKKGAKFEDVAQKNSDGPTAPQGGDLGYFNRGTLAKELEDLTFNAKPGTVTDVIRTKQGFDIIKVTAHDAAGIPPVKEVENQIQEAIYLQKLQPALRDYLTKLREDAFIDIKPGYIDSGASPNETKPIVTTAEADPNAKSKLKRKKKFLVF